MAKGAFPESHELHVGWPGMHGPKWSNYALNKADLIVAVGARFDDRVTGKLSAFAPGATVVHLDIDAAEISKIRHADIPVVGPLKPVLAELTRELAAKKVEPGRPSRGCARSPNGASSSRSATASRGRAAEAAEGARGAAGADGGPRRRRLDDRRRPAPDVGDAVPECDQPRTFITSGGLGTMGYGIPAAVGAKAARPDATVICVDGDGCFQMTWQELATAVLEELPIVVVIVNNGYLGMVRQWQDMFFDERFSQIHLTQTLPDYAKLAQRLRRARASPSRTRRSSTRRSRGARLRPHVRRRRARRSARALLPDDPGGRRRARHRWSSRTRTRWVA